MSAPAVLSWSMAQADLARAKRDLAALERRVEAFWRDRKRPEVLQAEAEQFGPACDEPAPETGSAYAFACHSARVRAAQRARQEVLDQAGLARRLLEVDELMLSDARAAIESAEKRLAKWNDAAPPAA